MSKKAKRVHRSEDERIAALLAEIEMLETKKKKKSSIFVKEILNTCSFLNRALDVSMEDEPEEWHPLYNGFLALRDTAKSLVEDAGLRWPARKIREAKEEEAAE